MKRFSATRLKSDPVLIRKIEDVSAIRLVLKNCIYLNEDEIGQHEIEIPLTRLGERLYQIAIRKSKLANENLVKLALFIVFYHHDFYIDIPLLNVEELEKKVNIWIKNDWIRFPWIYGRELYDKYFQEFDEQKEELNYEETKKLLEGSYRGVFQIGNRIVGPFGILRSKITRKLIPKIKMPLWHCPDPSCGNFHVTKFANSETSKIFDAIEHINYANRRKEVLDLNSYLTISKDIDFHNPYKLDGLCELIANSFSTEEMRIILRRIIDKTDIRERLPQNLRKGPSLDITKNLEKDQCLSLLLLTDDSSLLIHIEELIDNNTIIIPNTEIREPQFPLRSGHFGSYLQCSKLGIRVISRSKELAIPKLKKLIIDTNSEPHYREQLDWKLRDYGYESTFDKKINTYLHQVSPITAIKEMVFIGLAPLEKALAAIPGAFHTPNGKESEEKVIDKIAWKLGFSIKLFPSHIKDFWNNLAELRLKVTSNSNYNEIDRANIRSSSVNLFVLMEDILQQSLSFVTWALLSDHYLDTRFCYVYEVARQFMISKLNGFEFGENQTLSFDNDGKNTLFPLVSGFSALCKTCRGILKEPSIYKRPGHEFPSFYNYDPLRVFPFEHKVFLLDLPNADCNEFLSQIESISSEFGKGRILEIRNKLSHKRDDFPSQDEMLQAISSIEKSFSALENEGIFPNVCLFENLLTDEFNRKTIKVRNYKGRKVEFQITPELDGTHIPNAFEPTIVLESLKYGPTNHPVLFRFVEKSIFQTYWNGYPRKKISTKDRAQTS